jgi:hypothetical protein
VTGRRGSTALPAALAAVAVSAALGAAVAEIARVELAVARHRSATAAALAAADACLAEVVAAVPPGWTFDALLAGPDGRAGTADDGVTPAPPGCAARARIAPGPAVPPHALLHVQADAGGGRRMLDAVIGLDGAPGLPALLWLGRSPIGAAVAGTMRVDGANGDASGADWAGIAAPEDPDALDAWVASEAGHLLASARTAAPMTAAAPPLAALAARIRAAGPAGAEVLVPGTPSPALAFVAGDLPVSGALHGAGLLFVDGTLDITGALDFTGVVVASAGIRIRSGGSLDVGGALWGAASELVVDGSLVLRWDGRAIADADRLVTLPRRPLLRGLEDLG